MSEQAQDTLTQLTELTHKEHLDSFGMLHEDADTIVLLGPREPGFWPHVTASAEFQDNAPDPLDRWSKRVITQIGEHIGAQAIFPSDGPPYPPFISWALASQQAWVSPVGMLVHAHAGLFVSYRGALRLPFHLPLQTPAAAPCTTCAQPCRTACPVDALAPESYDVATCKSHIQSLDNADCRDQGCHARRACPISQSYARKPEQSAFHMRAFLGE